MNAAFTASASIAFGPFRLAPQRRELLMDGQPVIIGRRTFDVLMALIEVPGAVISKDALMARVWPNRIIEENALQAQISALRAALGAQRELIRTVSGRGYQFTGEIRMLSGSPDEPASAAVAATGAKLVASPTNLPAPVSELIGREEELSQLISLANAHRLVTLTGPGGIGKTRLAVAAARQLRSDFPDGVWVVEFSPLADPSLVPATVAAAVGLELSAGERSAQRLAQALSHRRILLVLDTCDHVVIAAATVAEAILRTGSTARVIATSREPLKAEGEWVYPVPPLAVPTDDAHKAEDPSHYGAVRLFLARAQAADPHFEPDRQTNAVIAALCRRLDGIPLAIELAAARTATLGINELAARLDDRFQFLTGGRRTALPRHQTLRAALDWSYGLLAEPERIVLRRLAVFAGGFSLEAARAVVASAEIAPPEVADRLYSLIAKSLVVANVAAILRYRLLDTTRAYAHEKLLESGERGLLARRHAEYFRDLFERAESNAEGRPDCLHQIDNLRAALDWAFSPDGDPTIGVALSAASAQIWLDASLLTECDLWMAKALDHIDAAHRGTRREMVLQSALALSLMFTSDTSSKALVALSRAVELAESVPDVGYQLRAVTGLALLYLRLEDPRRALAFARRSEALADGSANAVSASIADSIIGASLFYLGQYAAASIYAERAHHRATPMARRAQIVHSGMDYSILARCVTAQILWLQGLPDQSAKATQEVLADGEATNHAVSFCQALAWAGCRISLRLGDLAAGEHSIVRLKDEAHRNGLSSYYACALGFEGQLAAIRGNMEEGVRLLRACLDRLRESPLENVYTHFLSIFAEVLAAAGHADNSLAAAAEALRRAVRNDAFWWMPEALRITGEALLAGGADIAAAENHFRRSLDLARQQGAWSWELRTATSLARLQRDRSCYPEAPTLLATIYDRFTEGFSTTDLRNAKRLLDELT
jgi:predicted ATPase/DNA-binding winged helix-turn-helix (wHTH) protein